ncbi:MAG: hypothetical protein SGCHY_000149 [Lobulomycetales sp.]
MCFISNLNKPDAVFDNQKTVMEAFLEEERQKQVKRVRELFNGLALFEEAGSDSNQYDELFCPRGSGGSKREGTAVQGKLASNQSQSLSKFMPNVVHTPKLAGTSKLPSVVHTPKREIPQQVASILPPAQLPSPAREDEDDDGYSSLLDFRHERAPGAEAKAKSATVENAGYVSPPPERKQKTLVKVETRGGMIASSCKKRVHFPEDLQLQWEAPLTPISTI